MNARIESVAVAVPRTVRDNSWFAERFPDVLQRVERQTLARVMNDTAAAEGSASFDSTMRPYLEDPFRGTRVRRILADEHTAIDLEMAAARDALAAAEIGVDDIDLVLVAGFPSMEPAVGDAAFLMKALCWRVPAWNLESACSGAMAGLQLAGSMIHAGQARRILVVVCCVYSRVADWSDSISWFLGDGAGAYVVGPADSPGLMGFHAVSTAHSCGAFRVDVDQSADGVPRRHIRAGKEASRILREFTPEAIETACGAALRAAGLNRDQVGIYVPNTPMAWFADMFAQVLDVPRESVASTYSEFANCGPAMGPLNLHAALAAHPSRPRRGLLFSIGSVSTAVAAVIDPSRIRTAPLTEV